LRISSFGTGSGFSRLIDRVVRMISTAVFGLRGQQEILDAALTLPA
jgi:hypothetical protein